MFYGVLDSSTTVTFASGEIERESTIIALAEYEHHLAIFTPETPFHPVDYNWPDHPADKGMIVIGESDKQIVINCLVAAFNKQSGELYFDQHIPVKRNTEGWIFLVAHILEKENAIESYKNWLGKQVNLFVDQDYRTALSKGHTLCHLAALALNKETRHLWQKEIKELDSLGNIDFDALACQSSMVCQNGSSDTYRLGKSLKKKGFNKELLHEQLAEIEENIKSRVFLWANKTLYPQMTPAITRLDELREWSCTLPDGIAKIKCGGAHVQTLLIKNKDELDLRLTLNEDKDTLAMRCSLR
ncbi:MAG: hypothetical protein LBI71_07115 [Enterobacteriaceae bacterium]|jgi:alanyl-tRNA synthetase|nr:hypothetical protein [Enterobacteriaceae bacterium]